MFPNEQGIWLHDTPEKEKIEDAARLQSNGCVRLEDAPRFARWLFNGRPPKTQGARPEQKVNLPAPVPLYITYLTAVPSGTSIVYFDDFYGKDRAAARQVASATLAGAASSPRAASTYHGRSIVTSLLLLLRGEAAPGRIAGRTGLRTCPPAPSGRCRGPGRPRRRRSRALCRATRRGRIRPSHPWRRCCGASPRRLAPSIDGDRTAHQPVARLAACRRSHPPRP